MSIKTCSGSDSQLAKYEADLYQCRQQRDKNEAAGEVRRGEKLLLLRKMLYFVARQSGVKSFTLRMYLRAFEPLRGHIWTLL